MEDSIKIILIGKIGKSSFIRNLKGEFDRRYDPTMGVKTVPIVLGENLNVILYDTPGQEFNPSWENLYNNTDCAIFFFDKSSIMSFNYAKQELKKYKTLKRNNNKTPISVLYGIEDMGTVVKIKPDQIIKLHVNYMGGSNKIPGSAIKVLVKILSLLYKDISKIKQARRLILDDGLSSMTEAGLLDIIGDYDDYPYSEKLKTFLKNGATFNFNTQQSRRKRSVRKQSRRKRSVRKQSRRKRSVRK